MDFRTCFCIVLASLASVLHAAPEFLGGTAPRTAFALESYAIRRPVAFYPVIDLANPTFELATSQEWAVSITLAGAGTLPVTITVYQTNFPPTFFVDNYREEIDETASVGSTVVTVTAVDLAAELGSDPSDGVFVYEFDGEDSIYFSIDPDSGVITLARSVDYDTGNTEFVFNVGLSPTPSSKVANCSDMSSLTVYFLAPFLTFLSARFDIERDTPMYTMTLEVTDTGGLSDSVTIDVTVADENDNLPVITNNPLTADESVLECQLDGRPLSTVTAVDTADGGALAEVAYEVVGGDTNHILLNEETGELSLGFAPIDYEDPLERSFSLSVKAIDNPNGPVTRQQKSLETFIQTLTIGDCNDNPPVFGSPTYEYTVTENMNNLVGPLISTTDADATVANQGVTYQITDPDPGNWFDIAADGTLSIRSEQVVDREHTGVLTDSQGNGVVSFTIEAVNAGTSGTLTSVQDAQVVVTISDQNDNAPTMDENPLTGTTSIVVLEDALVGTILAVVRASDPDVGDNAVIMYKISSGNDLGKFSLDETNGVLTLAEPIDFEMEARSTP
ncbi:Protocadherin Fat 1 [Geodia barretti]|uniref:Protocadherin Fat 1 n=1 Tax=Geodia barretti TaxID=519541 RepID=A0AA35QVC4_GEOBA|nr:Protocadherin Fat 1 [Geodia barretti]